MRKRLSQADEYFIDLLNRVNNHIRGVVVNNEDAEIALFLNVMHIFDANKHKGLWHFKLPIEMPVHLVIDAQRNVYLQVIETAMFGGFREFERVSQCPLCSSYFLLLRTDAKFCSDTCSSRSRQETYRVKGKRANNLQPQN